jgi:hypothetical protein
MPREYSASRQPNNLIHAESAWTYEGAKDREKFYYEVRETREFSVEDILWEISKIYDLRPEDFSSIVVKKESPGGMLENVELYLDPELSMRSFGHKVSFDFTVEGRISERIQGQVTSISRTDYYEDGDVGGGEGLMDYDRTKELWIMKSDIKLIEIKR